MIGPESCGDTPVGYNLWDSRSCLNTLVIGKGLQRQDGLVLGGIAYKKTYRCLGRVWTHPGGI